MPINLPAPALELIAGRLNVPLEDLTLEVAADPKDVANAKFPPELRVDETDPTKTRLRLDTVAATVPDDSVDAHLANLQPALKPLGVQCLRATQTDADFARLFGMGLLEVEQTYGGKALLVFFAAERPDAFLWARATNGANNGVYTQDVIDRLERWRGLADLTVTGAGTDWLELTFTRLPAELEAFAQDVYDFCPDTLDQNVVKQPPAGLDEEEMADFFEKALDEQTPADLADFLRRQKRIFLWWD